MRYPPKFLYFLLVLSLFVLVLSARVPGKQTPKTELVLAKKAISLENRQANEWVNSVFKDNILLNLAYLRESKIQPTKVAWETLRQPFTYAYTLQPQGVFAFHNTVLPQYRGKVTKTTNATFSADQGFKSDGYLMGDGVCHLASLIYWAAKDAGLKTQAPTNHDFAMIPQVPKEYGVAIYKTPTDTSVSANQNLYITNNKDIPVTFQFIYDGKNLTVSILEKTQS